MIEYRTKFNSDNNGSCLEVMKHVIYPNENMNEK